jgi:plastocyanin
MFKYLSIFTFFSAILLLGVGCNTTKFDTGNKVQNDVTPSVDNQIEVSYTVDKKEENKQTNAIEKADKKKTEAPVQLKIEEVTQKSVSTNNVEKSAPKTVTIDISGFNFSPSVVKIKAGDTVRWVNNDDAPHKVASNPHPAHTDLPGLISGDLFKGDSYSFTFDKVGTWSYHCHLHPSMSGVVIVE